jgi:hypothetical protein
MSIETGVMPVERREQVTRTDLRFQRANRHKKRRQGMGPIEPRIGRTKVCRSFGIGGFISAVK